MKNILKYKKHKAWYININKALKNKYKKDYILFAGLLSATSPRFQIKRNFNTSINIYNDFKIKGKRLIKYFKDNEKEALKKYKILKAHYNNIIRVLENGNNKGLQLSGNKVNSFYNNLIGNYGYITIDVWMLKLFKHKGRNTPNKSQYKMYGQYVKAIRRHFKKRYNLKADNSGIQAILWEYIRSLKGFKPSNFNNHI